MYHNDPKFSDRQVLANSADPNQTAPEETKLSSTLSTHFEHIILR